MRKAKGLALQKILENTQKPWFMLNGGQEHPRPHPEKANQDNEKSSGKNSPEDTIMKSAKKTTSDRSTVTREREGASPSHSTNSQNRQLKDTAKFMDQILSNTHGSTLGTN